MKEFAPQEQILSFKSRPHFEMGMSVQVSTRELTKMISLCNNIGKNINRYPFSIKQCIKNSKMSKLRPRGYKTFSMINSIEHETFPTHKY